MKNPSVFTMTILLFLLTTELYGQPITFTKPIPNRMLLLDDLTISFNVDQKVVEKYRYKLKLPRAWRYGLKYAFGDWSEWSTEKNTNVSYGGLQEEGRYEFIVEYLNKADTYEWGQSRTKSIKKDIEVYWEYPEIRADAFNINFDWINQAPNEKEKYKRAAEEYYKNYEMWLKKFEYESNMLKLTQSPSEMIKLLVKEIVVHDIGALLKAGSMATKSTIAAGGLKIGSAVLAGAAIAGLIQQGYTSFAMVYRNRNTNTAATMAALAYKSYDLCLQKSK